MSNAMISFEMLGVEILVELHIFSIVIFLFEISVRNFASFISHLLQNGYLKISTFKSVILSKIFKNELLYQRTQTHQPPSRFFAVIKKNRKNQKRILINFPIFHIVVFISRQFSKYWYPQSWVTKNCCVLTSWTCFLTSITESSLHTQCLN